MAAESHCASCSATWCPLLLAGLLCFSSSSPHFVSQLSQRLSAAAAQQRRTKRKTTEREEGEDRHQENRPESTEAPSQVEGTDVGSPSPSSRDGYFEMGLDDSVEESVCSSSEPHAAPPAGTSVQEEEEEEAEGDEEEEEVQVIRAVWCYCLQVDKHEEEEEGEVKVKQRGACLVLTERLLGLLFLSEELLRTNQEADRTLGSEELLSGLQMDELLPLPQLLLLSQPQLPDCCLALGLRGSSARWFVFSQAQEILQTRLELLRLTQTEQQPPGSPQLLPRFLLNSWELEESRGAQGGFLAHLLPSSSSSSSSPDAPPLLSEIISKAEEATFPSLLFLTHRHLWVLRLDFRELVEQSAAALPPSSSSSSSSQCRLVRVPLGSVLLHPRERALQVERSPSSLSSCQDPKHQSRRNHTVELLLGALRLWVLFPLSLDRASFLEELSQRRGALEGVKMVALPRTPRTPRRCTHHAQHTHGGFKPRDQCNCTSNASSSSWEASALQMEENQPSPHLLPGLSPGLKLLAGLAGQQRLPYFHRYIALSEAEEVRQVLWLSVVLYKSPEAELTCCLLLSTDTIYFLLEDSAASLASHSVLDVTECGDADVLLCCCLTIRLSELLSVNVGLFDQYFRVVGHSADHIVCCLSRDSYGTGVFLQELMSALSLQQQLPPPEPSDQDFYSQFTNTNTGKMQNYELVHSSRVKFVYPSEEEMGDLTFIVAERKTPAGAAAAASSSSRSFNVLLYLLVFQVQVPSSPPSQGSSLSGPASFPSSASSPVLQPRTLILTSTDVFLLDEDYVSYPLPDFAKEPPSRERYQLREARRIRDLDRVLLGYQTYPQALTLVFDDLPGPDLLCHLTMDHFATEGEEPPARGGGGGAGGGGAEGEVQWCVFVPGAESRERLISLLARQWEALCSRELPVELTG